MTGMGDKLKAAKCLPACSWVLAEIPAASGPRDMTSCPEQCVFPSHCPEMSIHQQLFAVMSFIF